MAPAPYCPVMIAIDLSSTFGCSLLLLRRPVYASLQLDGGNHLKRPMRRYPRRGRLPPSPTGISVDRTAGESAHCHKNRQQVGSGIMLQDKVPHVRTPLTRPASKANIIPVAACNNTRQVCPDLPKCLRRRLSIESRSSPSTPVSRHSAPAFPRCQSVRPHLLRREPFCFRP